MVELAMRQANRNQTHAAKLLDISRHALRYKPKKFGLVREEEEEEEEEEEDPVRTDLAACDAVEMLAPSLRVSLWKFHSEEAATGA